LSVAARQSLAEASLNAASAPTGIAVAWDAEDAQGHPTAGGSVVPARNAYLSHRGIICRDLQQHVQTPDGGASEQVTLCRNDMGDNRILWLPGSPD
jgi:surface antigen